MTFITDQVRFRHVSFVCLFMCLLPCFLYIYILLVPVSASNALKKSIKEAQQ